MLVPRLKELCNKKGVSFVQFEGEISKEEYQKRKDALTVIPPVKQPTPRIKEIALSGDDLRESYQSFTRQEKRAVWKSVVNRIDVDGDVLTVTFRA